MSQINIAIRSLAELKTKLAEIEQHVIAGTRVLVGYPAGYKNNGYTIFNVERWNPSSNSPYVACYEPNHSPKCWDALLWPIAMRSPHCSGIAGETPNAVESLECLEAKAASVPEFSKSPAACAWLKSARLHIGAAN